MSHLVPLPLREAIRICLSQFRDRADAAGISTDASFNALLRQIYDSVRRVEYYFALRKRKFDPTRGDPASESFDPIRAAIQQHRLGLLDEAAWLAFLSTHFGVNVRTRWRLVREVYGSLGDGTRWNWARVRKDPKRLSDWITDNHGRFRGIFGNHRKYMSLKPSAPAGTAQAIESYVLWINSYSSHTQLSLTFQDRAGDNQSLLFDAIYKDMKKNIKAFGRTGCFDYLCTMGKLGFLPIEPGSPYIVGSTGPRKGVATLLGNAQLKPKELEHKVKPLGSALSDAGVNYAMQVLEDAICNWQKNPNQYRKFRG